ncbi:MAG TPA: endonuclease/exonuclease/phosphatase family protein [Candidatus Binatia bacterium]
MQVFSVLSYNIHECVGSDRWRNPARIAEVIKESGADIIGLQEVHSDASGTEELHQMNYLAAASGLQAIPGPAVERKNGHYGNVLLTRYKILAVHNLNLSYPGREPRGAIDAELEIHGATVRVIVTHLGLRPAERRFQVKKLLFAISEPRASTIIILSDFNEWLPTGRSLRWIHTQLGKTALVRTFPSYFPIFALDRIWVSPAGALVKVFRVRTPLTRIASDHLPLKAIIRTPPAVSSK